MIPSQIIIHHSASGNSTTLEQINEWHKARDFTLSKLGFYIGYHYVIFPNGDKKQVRLDNEIGCHSIPNDGKIGICLVGNFQISDPTKPQIDQLNLLLNSLKKTYNVGNVLGHRDCNKTECPGDNLYKFVLLDKINWLQQLINKLLNRPKTNA